MSYGYNAYDADQLDYKHDDPYRPITHGRTPSTSRQQQQWDKYKTPGSASQSRRHGPSTRANSSRAPPPVRSLNDMIGNNSSYGRYDENTPSLGTRRMRSHTQPGPSPGLSPIKPDAATPTPMRPSSIYQFKTPQTQGHTGGRAAASFAYTPGGASGYGGSAVTNAVTVYGFPADKAWLITEKFQKYGDIERRWPGSGNWMHIQYKDLVHAQRALAQNGRQIEEDLMIGVQPLDVSRFSKDIDRPNDDVMDGSIRYHTPSTLGNRRRRGFNNNVIGRGQGQEMSDLEFVDRPRSTICTRFCGYFLNW